MDSLRRFFPLLGVPLVLATAGCPPVERPKDETRVVYWSADDFAARLGMRVTQQSPAGATMTDGRNSVMVFTGPTGLLYFNGRRYGPPNNAFYLNGKVYLLAAREPALRWELEHQPTVRPPPRPPDQLPRRFAATIVVDAGHGGKDPGTLGRGRGALPEKAIVLDIALNLQKQLKDRGASVVMTRWGDTFVELDDRCAVAERARADLFVAIHVNASGRSDAAGATLYVGNNASNESEGAARAIEAALLRSGVGCNGIQHKRFRVLVGHSRPAVLIECGFVTNPAEARRLNSPEYRAALAAAIADGVAAHFCR
jgi:N-acetylmuramoyl-L-alanine amidase